MVNIKASSMRVHFALQNQTHHFQNLILDLHRPALIKTNSLSTSRRILINWQVTIRSRPPQSIETIKLMFLLLLSNNSRIETPKLRPLKTMTYNWAKPNKPKSNSKSTWKRKTSCRKNWIRCKRSIIRSIWVILCRITDLIKGVITWIRRLSYLGSRDSILDSRVTSFCTSNSLRSREELACLRIGCRAHSQLRRSLNLPIDSLRISTIMILLILRNHSTLILAPNIWICHYKCPISSTFSLNSNKILWWAIRRWCHLNTPNPFLLKSPMGALIMRGLILDTRVAKVDDRQHLSHIMDPKLVHQSPESTNWPRLKK